MELDNILAEEEQKPQPQASDPESEEKKSTEDQLAKEKQELENLKQAKREALEELKKAREEKSKVKKSKEEIPQIDWEDPGSKAWGKHIEEKVTPLQKEMEQERQERFDFALSRMMDEYPDLADKERLKEVVEIYNALPQARTVEGMMGNIEKALGAVDPEALVTRARERRGEKVRSDMAFSQPAISRGASSYQAEKESKQPSDELKSQEEIDAVIRMYGSLKAYDEFVKKNRT